MGSTEKFAVELRDLTLGHASAAPLVSCASASFAPATLTALIGRNGSGKSTLLRTLAGLSASYSGTILIGGDDLRSLPSSALARRMAFVSTRRIRVPSMSAREVAAMGRAPWTGWTGRLSDADSRAVDAAMQTAGIASLAGRPVDTLSDGEAQRVMIARAIAQATPLMLLDEPTSFLDLPGRFELASMLRTLAHDHHRCIIFSTHELDLALSCADMIAIIGDNTIYNMNIHAVRESKIITKLFGVIPSAIG